VEAAGRTDRLAEEDAVAFGRLVRVEVEVDCTAKGLWLVCCCTNGDVTILCQMITMQTYCMHLYSQFCFREGGLSSLTVVWN